VLAIFAALFFTVALLVTSAYFLLGALPLLVLKHDTPLDGRFVRGFFNTYYVATMVTAGGTAASFALMGRAGFAIGAAAIVAAAAALRKKLLGRMDAVRAQIGDSGVEAIRQFRGLHLMAIGLTLVQLVVVVSSLMSLSL